MRSSARFIRIGENAVFANTNADASSSRDVHTLLAATAGAAVGGSAVRFRRDSRTVQATQHFRHDIPN
jgi:hypothetical protein